MQACTWTACSQKASHLATTRQSYSASLQFSSSSTSKRACLLRRKCSCNRRTGLIVAASKWNQNKWNQGKWDDWKSKSKYWTNSRWWQNKATNKLQRKLQKKQLLLPATALPVVAGLAVASMFGPLMFAATAGFLGLAFATVAGMTAVALFLPAAFFIGGTLAAFSVLGSLLSLLGLVPLVAIGWTLYNRSGKAKIEAAQQEAEIRRDEWQAKEYRRQQEELEFARTEIQELEDFDKRLRSR